MNLSNNTILIIAGLFLWQVIGLASVTALAANHRWGVWVCVASAFVSNAIHANLFVAPSLAGGFYTLLPCVLVYLFADMYKNKNTL